MSIGQNIKRIREARGMTQLELAERLCITQPAIARFETGSKMPSVPILKLMSEVLDCSADELLAVK